MMRNACVRGALVSLTLLIAAAPLAALAQSTGGSVGGGSFGGSSGSSDYGGSSSSGSYGSSSSGSYGSSSSSGADGFEWPRWAPWCLGAFVAVYIPLMIWNASIPGGFAGRRRRRQEAKRWERGQVAVLRLGIDWRARRAVQARLLELARTSDTATPAGLAALLRETVSLLRGVQLSWLYASGHARSIAGAEPVEAAFRELTTDARARFQRELVRAADASVTTAEAPLELEAKAHEGEGVVVVTLVVAARSEPLGREASDPATDAGHLLAALEGVASPASLAAVEVIWSPAAEEDRMSTAELEQHYPELRKIDETAIAGRVFCRYCRGPFAMELLECPHCGAPIEARPASPG